MQPSTLRLLLSDGKEYVMDKRIVKFSNLIKNILEDSSEEEAIPLGGQVTPGVLDLISKFMAIHDYEVPTFAAKVTSSNLKENLPKDDYELISSYTIETLQPVVQGAYFLDIPSLVDLCVIRIATEFYVDASADSLEKLKKKFNITEDLTPEREEQLIEEYPFLREMLLTPTSQEKNKSV